MDIKTFFKFAKNVKLQLITLLVMLFLLALHRASVDQYGLLSLQVGLAVLTAILAEWAFFGPVKATSIQSAIISGMLIGLLLVPGIEFSILWFAVTMAIASKVLFRFPSEKHIFNPAAGGLILISLFWGNQINWWGFSNPYLVIILGGIILYRMNRLSLMFSYLFFRLVGLFFFNGMQMNEQLLLLPNLFFAFIMLVEPKTSPAKRPAQWIFGGSVGLLSTFLFHMTPMLDGDLIALFSLNFLRPIIEKKRFF